MRAALLALSLCAGLPSAIAGQAEPAPETRDSITWEEAEEFLSAARMGKMKTLPVGVSRPLKVDLALGERRARGVFKTIDEFHPGLKRFDDGTFEIGFTDSYKHEIAAYRLDRLLGLDLVPPTVERRARGESGSLQLWLEGCITESERLAQKLVAPDLERWNRQIYNVRLLRQLTYDTDFNNVGNILIDGSFRVYAIDFSRAFRLSHDLLAAGDLKRFSRPALERLRGLDRAALEQDLGKWLTRGQIEALLARRDLILERAAKLTSEQGETAVLFP